MKNRWGLIQRGLFPETVPPCFTSKDLKRSFSGLVRELKVREFRRKRETDYIRYSGTKHDRTRRYFGTPNPISYFYVASFIAEHWEDFEQRFGQSPFSVSRPKVASEKDDRPIIIPSLSELTTTASRKLGRSAYILKTDVSQFFPSIYTHSIPWVAHGIEESKRDTDPSSAVNYFNALDFHVRNCQRGETRGLLVGPDAFRVISEFVATRIDLEFFESAKDYVIGGARHVDDYYIGVSSETDSTAALSVLREKLQRYSLHINDVKTKTMAGVEPLNEVWAQSLRKDARALRYTYVDRESDYVLIINRSLALSNEIGSDSPLKIALRALDQVSIYQSSSWSIIEPYLQRLMYHHPHCVDYASLLVAKRVALGSQIDRDGWSDVCHELIARHLPFNHHHEVLWFLWILVSAGLELRPALVESLANNSNAHIKAFLLAAFIDGHISQRPKIGLPAKLPTTDDQWLVNLVARSSEFSKAPFSGALTEEFDHLSAKGVRLIDFKAHMNDVRRHSVQAISRTRYGYDSDDDSDFRFGGVAEDIDWGD